MSTMTQQDLRGVVPQWTIGDRLRKAREVAGFDQQQLAEAACISRGTVQNYEADRFGRTRTEPSRLHLRAWAAATGVPAQWLLTGETTKAPAAVATGASASECAPWDLNPEPADAGSALLRARVAWLLPTQRHVAHDTHTSASAGPDEAADGAAEAASLTVPTQLVAGRRRSHRVA